MGRNGVRVAANVNDARRVTVHDGVDVGARTVDLAVDETLEVDAASAGIVRVAVQVERQDVVRGHESRRHVAREQEMRWRCVVPHADVSEAVDDTLVVQNAVGDGEPFDALAVRGWRQGHGIPRSEQRVDVFL